MPRLWVLTSLCVVAVLAHTHSHEPAAYKYSREANEAAHAEHDHHHSHDHGHSHDEYDHGHAHDHGHSHEGGGCPYANKHSHGEEEQHGHAHDHGHSHGAGADHGHSHEHHSHSGGAPVKREAPAQYSGSLSFMNDARTRLWVHAIGATLLISIAPFIILFAIPINSNTAESGPLLKVLLAFGSGGLLGDAFLHLIPHAAPAGGEGHGHSHSHSHSHGHSHGEGGHDMSVGAWVLAGIIGFLIVEKLVRILRGEEGHGHSHGHSHGGKAKSSDDEGKKKKAKGKEKGDPKEEKDKLAEKDCKPEIRVAAYLNLVADFAHNFTDGLAIGASFIAGSTIGFVTMVTVLVHEVPHEIGDFAILIQSGYTRRKAMMMQLVTAAGALSGCIISLWAADSSVADAAASSWILPFTAGGFIYIATVSVIPELLENSSLGQSLKEIAALLLGIFLMYLIAIYE